MLETLDKFIKEKQKLFEELRDLLNPLIEEIFNISMMIALNIKYNETPKLLTYNKVEHKSCLAMTQARL